MSWRNARPIAADWMNGNSSWPRCAAANRWRFLNHFPREEPFVFNEGGWSTLSFIPTLATMILGLLTGEWLKSKKSKEEKLRGLVIGGIGLVLLGLIYELAAAGARPEWGESPEQLALRGEIDAVAVRINGYVDELGQVGCLLKGFGDGLVDFYGLQEGRLVFLCWRLGEEAVTHWHELDAGVAGRRPITPEFVSTEGGPGS